jgi:hypothetical protein
LEAQKNGTLPIKEIQEINEIETSKQARKIKAKRVLCKDQ